MTDARQEPGGSAKTLEAGSNTSPGVAGEARKTQLGPAASRGRTSIADGVVEKIAGMAVREVSGVHDLGTGLSRTFGAVRERVPGGRSSATRGVKAEVGEVQTALDLDIVIEYGVSIVEVAHDVRENVVAAVERMTGLQVVEVNIAVGDVKLPEEEEESEEQRVQ
jgi:uncharacterized alkaline shock family protein YloU